MTVKKTKDVNEERFNKIVTIILIIFMAVALVESIKTRVDIHNYIESKNTEECALEDTSLE